MGCLSLGKASDAFFFQFGILGKGKVANPDPQGVSVERWLYKAELSRNGAVSESEGWSHYQAQSTNAIITSLKTLNCHSLN